MDSNFVIVQKSLVNFLDLDENTGQLQAKGCMYLCSMWLILATHLSFLAQLISVITTLLTNSEHYFHV